MPAGLVVAEAVRIVVADIDAGSEIGGKPDEPGIMEIICGPGLAGNGLTDGTHEQCRCRVAPRPATWLRSERPNQDQLPAPSVPDDRHWLMPPDGITATIAMPLVGPEDRLAIAVLDAIDQARGNALAHHSPALNRRSSSAIGSSHPCRGPSNIPAAYVP